MALSLSPQNINKKNWYYEESSGIQLVHQVYVNGELVQTDQVLIPWRMIEKSVKRKPPKGSKVR